MIKTKAVFYIKHMLIFVYYWYNKII